MYTTTAIYCTDECNCEGIWDNASDVLWCDNCGLPALVRARTNLAKSIRRGDNVGITADYAKVYAATFVKADAQQHIGGSR
jgi:hypothetical protein